MSESEDLKLWSDVWKTFHEEWNTNRLRGFLINKPPDYQNEFKRRWYCMRDNRASGYKSEIKT